MTTETRGLAMLRRPCARSTRRSAAHTRSTSASRHRREQRQRHGLARDALGVRELSFAEALRAEERREVDRLVGDADADALLVHRVDELPARDVPSRASGSSTVNMFQLWPGLSRGGRRSGREQVVAVEAARSSGARGARARGTTRRGASAARGRGARRRPRGCTCRRRARRRACRRAGARCRGSAAARIAACLRARRSAPARRPRWWSCSCWGGS